MPASVGAGARGVSAGDLLALQGLHLDIQVSSLAIRSSSCKRFCHKLPATQPAAAPHATADDRLFGIARDRIRQACTEQCTTGATDGLPESLPASLSVAQPLSATAPAGRLIFG